MDLYAILSLPREATLVEIKRAYRRLCHKHHPDKQGGDRARFEPVQLAYEVLTDPERRKEYDETGNYSDDSKTIADTVSSLFLKMLDQHGVLADLVALVRETINEQMAGFRDASTLASQSIQKLKKQRGKIISKTDRNVLRDAIDGRIQQQLKFISDREDAIALGEKMLKFLADYQWQEEPQSKSVWQRYCEISN